jgi:hypothetical protein
MPLRLCVCGQRTRAIEVEGAAGKGLGDGNGEGPVGEGLGDGDGEGPVGEGLDDGDKGCPTGEGLGGALKSSYIGDMEVGVAQVVDGPTSCCIGDGNEGKAGDEDAGVVQSPDRAGDEGDGVVGREELASEANTGEAGAAWSAHGPRPCKGAP